eukprot:gene2204-biopygen2115
MADQVDSGSGAQSEAAVPVPPVVAPTPAAGIEALIAQQTAMYNLYNDKTYNALSKRINSSMRYEQLVLAPALSYMHDMIAYSEEMMDWLQDEKDPPNFEELGRDAPAAGVDGHRNSQVLADRRLGPRKAEATCLLRIPGAKARNEQRASGNGFSLAELTLCELQGARVLPYMDDFLVLASSRIEALMARELTSRVLTRLGLGRKKKKGQCPTRAKLHTDSSLFAWGGVLNLKHAVRGFWPDELRDLHITHLELKAVHKTVQAFLRELTGKVVRLYCDNQAVVAMLSHFTTRRAHAENAARILLDLNGIELQARYIRSEANEWADRLSLDRDLDDWRLNRRQWLQWAERFLARRASEAGTSGTPASGATERCKVQVYLPIDDAWYNGTVGATGEDGLTHVAYDDGDVEDLNMSKER